MRSYMLNVMCEVTLVGDNKWIWEKERQKKKGRQQWETTVKEQEGGKKETERKVGGDTKCEMEREWNGEQLVSLVLVRVPINMSTYLPYLQRRQEGFLLYDVLMALEFVSRQSTTCILVIPPPQTNRRIQLIRTKNQNDLTLSEGHFLLNTSKTHVNEVKAAGS